MFEIFLWRVEVIISFISVYEETTFRERNISNLSKNQI